MNRPSKLARVAVLASSLTMLMGYIVYSHLTENDGSDAIKQPSRVVIPEAAKSMEKSRTRRTRDVFLMPSSKVMNKALFTLVHKDAEPIKIAGEHIENIFWRSPAPLRFERFGIAIDARSQKYAP